MSGEPVSPGASLLAASSLRPLCPPRGPSPPHAVTGRAGSGGSGAEWQACTRGPGTGFPGKAPRPMPVVGPGRPPTLCSPRPSLAFTSRSHKKQSQSQSLGRVYGYFPPSCQSGFTISGDKVGAACPPSPAARSPGRGPPGRGPVLSCTLIRSASQAMGKLGTSLSSGHVMMNGARKPVLLVGAPTHGRPCGPGRSPGGRDGTRPRGRPPWACTLLSHAHPAVGPCGRDLSPRVGATACPVQTPTALQPHRRAAGGSGLLSWPREAVAGPRADSEERPLARAPASQGRSARSAALSAFPSDSAFLTAGTGRWSSARLESGLHQGAGGRGGDTGSLGRRKGGRAAGGLEVRQEGGAAGGVAELAVLGLGAQAAAAPP